MRSKMFAKIALGVAVLSVVVSIFVLVHTPVEEVELVKLNTTTEVGLSIKNAAELRGIVVVKGEVLGVDEDYVSKGGNVFQQFYVGDGMGELKVFTRVDGERLSVEVGEEVVLRGELVEFNGEMELVDVKKLD